MAIRSHIIIFFFAIGATGCGDSFFKDKQPDQNSGLPSNSGTIDFEPISGTDNPIGIVDSTVTDEINPGLEFFEFQNAALQDNGLDSRGQLLPVEEFANNPNVTPEPVTNFHDLPSGTNLQDSDQFSVSLNSNAPAAALPFVDEGFEPFSFVNYESPHVHPVDITPDNSRLLAVNTADNALMVFDISAGTAQFVRSIPVGVDPVSVRVLSNDEAWVVNHISDTISVVDLATFSVRDTIYAYDEPTDVVFAGSPRRAFVSLSQVNHVMVVDTISPYRTIDKVYIHGEDPRMLAVSKDGQRVFAAIFESGNGTTLVAGGKNSPGKITDAVVATQGPYGGMNVPPNDGNNYSPEINPSLPPPAPVSMIVKKSPGGRWLDDNEGDWSRLISGDLSNISNRVQGWDLPDNDIAVIDTNTLNVTYQSRMMNIVMALDVNPTNGRLMAVGTDATNEVRWEPNLQSTFVRVKVALVDTNGPNLIKDLNPHLNYVERRIAPNLRARSIGDPRGIDWINDHAMITGMGSNNVIVVDGGGNRTDLITVGEGPTGIKIDASRARAYVMNKFDGSISVVDTNLASEIDRVTFFDPTPVGIKEGRPLLYDTHATSGLGQASCASCHVDARTDRLVWDLGNPAGDMFSRNGFSFHPMKGPMKTQTLQDIIGVPALHHIGDKESIFDFANAFDTLQGTDGAMDAANMSKLEKMLDSVHYPPNPHRNIDNSLSKNVEIPGMRGAPYAVADAAVGREQFLTGIGTSSHCGSCHNNARTRTDIQKGPGNGFIVGQPLINENLRGFYDRMGMWRTDPTASTSGFGFLPDGAQSSEQINTSRNFPLQSQSGLDVQAFMLSLDGPVAGLSGLARDSHAGVGQQVSVTSQRLQSSMQRVNELLDIANSGNVGLVVRGTHNGQERGFYYETPGLFQSDKAVERLNTAQILDRMTSRDTVTFTLVARGSEYRIGVDADEDGKLNGDELSSTSNPRAKDSNWQECAIDGQRCSFSGTAAVRYGNTDTGEFLYGVFSGGVDCNQFVFGNNKLELQNRCYIGEQFSSSQPTPPPVTTIAQPTSPATQQCQAIDITNSAVVSYSGNQDRGEYEVLDGGNTIRVFNNGWKAIPLLTNIGPNTVLEFEFSSAALAEEHAIGFDEDLNLTNKKRFKLAGKQNTAAWSIGDFENYSIGSGFKKYRIPVGRYFQGTTAYLTLIADHDNGRPKGESIFRNITVYEDPEGDGCNTSTPLATTPPVDTNSPQPSTGQCIRLDLVQAAIKPYANQDFGQSEIVGNALRVHSNAWKAISTNATINPETVVEFDFKSNVEGEEHSIGFDSDLIFSQANRFKLYGTQIADAIQNFNDYPGGGITKHYKIPVGRFLNGEINHVFFTADHDYGSKDGESVFSNVVIYDDVGNNQCTF